MGSAIGNQIIHHFLVKLRPFNMHRLQTCSNGLDKVSIRRFTYNSTVPKWIDLVIVMKKGILFTFIMSTLSVTFLLCSMIVTGIGSTFTHICCDTVRTILPFKLDAVGPNMCAAAVMSCLAIGQFLRFFLSTISTKVLRLGCPILCCVLQARTARKQSDWVHLDLLSSKAFKGCCR